MNDNILEILKWVAIGKEIEQRDSNGDWFSDICAFDCGFDTQYDVTKDGPHNNKHSENCLMNISRRELSELGYPLRKYVVEYALTYTPTEGHQERFPFLGLREDRPRYETYYEIGRLKFNYTQFCFEKQSEEQNRIDPEQEKFIVSIKHETIIIHPPIFLLGTEDDQE